MTNDVYSFLFVKQILIDVMTGAKKGGESAPTIWNIHIWGTHVMAEYTDV